MRNNTSFPSVLLHLFCLTFILFLFLSLGADSRGIVQFRVFLGLLLILTFLLFFREQLRISEIRNGTFLLFGAFVLFEIFRFFWMLGSAYVLSRESGSFAVPTRSLWAALWWFFCFALMIVSFLFARSKRQTSRLLTVMSWSGFFLAMNAIPPLLMHHHAGYLINEIHWRFFFPFLYFHEGVAEYLIAASSHSNFIGDVIAFGFFPALGIFFYAVHQKKAGTEAVAVPFILLILTVTAAMAASILLLFSRGTIACFGVSLLVFLFLYLFKFLSRGHVFMMVLFVGVMGGFLSWAGNLGQAWKEIQTLDREFDSGQDVSMTVNIEGAKRAIAIYKDHPVWGIGTSGYRTVAKAYVTDGYHDKYPLPDYEAMCHYLHLLAEEGLGAVLYFLFLIAYFLEMMTGLFKTKSRFQFLMALSLFSAVLLVFGHAAINDLMQRYSMSMLVYLSMGASMGILHKGFQHSS